MHVLLNYWSIKCEERCIEVKGTDRPGSEEDIKRESRRRRAESGDAKFSLNVP